MTLLRNHCKVPPRHFDAVHRQGGLQHPGGNRADVPDEPAVLEDLPDQREPLVVLGESQVLVQESLQICERGRPLKVDSDPGAVQGLDLNLKPKP